MAVSAIGGYQVYCVDLGPALHYLYARQHKARGDTVGNDDRTLFVCNVSPVMSEKTLEHIFSQFAAVKEVQISTQAQQRHSETLAQRLYPTIQLGPGKDSGCFAHVSFKSKKGLAAALSPGRPTGIIDTSACVVRYGMADWLQECKQHPDRATLQQTANIAMELFEAQEEKNRQQRAQQAQADEDGWITVTRGKRKSHIDVDENDSQRAGGKKKKNKTVTVNLYRWQQREAMRDQIAELRRQFEGDKQKIAAMRSARKFRPY